VRASLNSPHHLKFHEFLARRITLGSLNIELVSSLKIAKYSACFFLNSELA
jgi:hypothetical protein